MPPKEPVTWPKVEETLNQLTDAYNDFGSWERWMDDRSPGILDNMDFEHKAELYALMVDMAPTFCPRCGREV